MGKPGISALARWAVGDLRVVGACPVSTLIPGPTVGPSPPTTGRRKPRQRRIRQRRGGRAGAPGGAHSGYRRVFPGPRGGFLRAVLDVDGALDKAVDLPEGIRDCSDPMIGKIIHETTKPSRDGAAASLVAHATPAWSRAHLERDKETVADEMLAHLRDLLKTDAAPVFHVAHRWRFAEVETAADVSFVCDNDRGLGACGDWCQGGGVEGAFESGAALATAILAS